jgi:alpha-L-rhamnosidase
MKRILLLFLIACLLPGAKDPGSGSPEGLMVEFIREPENVKILDLRPEFTWIVPQSAKIQTAYQVLVSTERKKSELNIGNTWDSGKTISRQSSEIEYGGEALLSNTTYFWRVRIWNGKNRSSGYSEIQSFTTGDPVGYATTSNRFISSLNKPDKLVKINDSHYFIDFGKDAFGTLILKIKPEQNDTITVHLGEKLSGEARIDKAPGGTIRYQKVLLPVSPGITEYKLNIPADVRNTGPAAVHLPDSFGVIIPFRYCELEGCHYEIASENIFQKSYSYYFDDRTSGFTSSDPILNSVWDICKYSMKASSFAGIYIDGDRERIPYEADAYINQLGHYYTDREYSMARATNEYFIKHPTWPTEWILHTVPMFYNDFMFTGNHESLKVFYDALKFKTLTALAREDGLISSKLANDEVMKSLGFTNPKERIRDIVDWPPAQKDTGWKLVTAEGERDGYDMKEINTVVNAFYYRNLVLMSAIAGYLGRADDSSHYKNLSVKVRDAFNRELFDKSKGIYTDGENSMHSSLHANMMALAFDLVPVNNIKSVTNFIKSRGMACSVYGSQYLLEGLYKAGEAGYAMSLLTAGNDRSWWNMIKKGSTITMEAWDMKYKPNSDWNHAWGAAPANIIPGYMWGITPAAPGFSKGIIRPQLSTLRQSSIKVPTIRGAIEAEYKASGKSGEYLITIPGNMEGEFILPDGKNYQVKSNGKKQSPVNGKINLDPGMNKISIIEVNL